MSLYFLHCLVIYGSLSLAMFIWRKKMLVISYPHKFFCAYFFSKSSTWNGWKFATEAHLTLHLQTRPCFMHKSNKNPLNIFPLCSNYYIIPLKLLTADPNRVRSESAREQGQILKSVLNQISMQLLGNRFIWTRYFWYRPDTYTRKIIKISINY